MTFDNLSLGKTLVIFFFASCVSIAHSASDTPPSNGKGNEKVAKTLEACRTLIGKKFWYMPSVEDKLFIRATASGDLPSRAFWSYLSIREQTDFVVVDCQPSEGKNFGLFKVEFKDGTFAYLITFDYSERRSDEYTVMDNMYPGRDKVYIGASKTPPSGYIYPGPPQEIVDAEERMASAKLAKAAAAWKARGGVRIGMTSAKVLKSNWGAPQNVNRTTTAKGTDEQWVYDGNNYLYFSNGILTVIQN